MRLGDLTGAESRASGLGAYCDAKLMLYVWASELQARLRRAGARVDCFATQPGCGGVRRLKRGGRARMKGAGQGRNAATAGWQTATPALAFLNPTHMAT